MKTKINNLFPLICFFFSLTLYSQVDLSQAQEETIDNLFEQLLINNEQTYILKHSSNNNIALLLYKFDNKIIIALNELFYGKELLKKNKETIIRLGGEIVAINQIDDDDEVIREIKAYKFVIDYNNINKLKEIVVRTLLKELNNAYQKGTLYFESIGN